MREIQTRWGAAVAAGWLQSPCSWALQEATSDMPSLGCSRTEVWRPPAGDLGVNSVDHGALPNLRIPSCRCLPNDGTKGFVGAKPQRNTRLEATGSGDLLGLPQRDQAPRGVTVT
ncbi:hypothetical protein DPEC_G00270680 [Dallia pectoralis]|uniref:Uncharacterized protein n=1 Tax=Dallia pectoralis TaxID=75939 RepID=A0ACC2FPJ0_DALPE|nr:hypothetical protein DPEC_G00270680 [Dallia pectoralis]